MKKKLRISNENKFIAGVCGGLGKYFNIDPTIVRIIFILSNFIFNFSPILIYIIFWIVIPKDNCSDDDNTKNSNEKFSDFSDFSEFDNDK